MRVTSTLMQMPQPIHRDSEIQTILLCGVTSIHSLPAKKVHKQLENTLHTGWRCRRACWSTHPCGPPGSSSCTPDGTSWACICHGWRWQSWCFYPPWWVLGWRTLTPMELHEKSTPTIHLHHILFLMTRQWEVMWTNIQTECDSFSLESLAPSSQCNKS